MRSTASTGTSAAPAWRATGGRGNCCSPPAPAAATACSWTPCGPGRPGFTRATRSGRKRAVAEFWSQLLVSESAGGLPVLARYDGQRPLVPWLIRVFQNAHISRLRAASGVHALPDDDVALPLPAAADGRWHEAFCQAARETLASLSDASC